MDEELIILSIIEEEFDNLSPKEIITNLDVIPQNNIKKIRLFLLKTLTDIENAKNNTIKKIKEYFQTINIQKCKVIKKLCSKSRNKPQVFTKNQELFKNIKNFTYDNEKLQSLAKKKNVSPFTNTMFTRINTQHFFNINNKMPKTIKSFSNQSCKTHKKIKSNNEEKRKIIIDNISSIKNSKNIFDHTNDNEKEKILNLTTTQNAITSKKLKTKSQNKINLSCRTENLNKNANNNNSNTNNINNTESNNTINNNTSLARDIITFVDNMKALQESIIKKDPNIKQMKYDFEKQKIQLYNNAKNVKKNTLTKCQDLKPLKMYQIMHENKLFLSSNQNQDLLDNKILLEYLSDSIKQIYNLLINNCKDKEINFIEELSPSQFLSKKKFSLYINEIIKLITNVKKNKKYKLDSIINLSFISSKKQFKEKAIQCIIINNNNIEINQKQNCKELKNEIFKLTIDVKSWASTLSDSNSINKLETQFNSSETSQCFNILKSEIKNLVISSEKNKTKNNCEDEILSERDNIINLNSTLLSVQNDLLHNLENKQKEIDNAKDELKNSLKLQKDFMEILKEHKTIQEVNIFKEKYQYLLNLLKKESERVSILQGEYIRMLSNLSKYIVNGEKILVDLGTMWNISKNKIEELKKNNLDYDAKDNEFI